MSLHDDKEEILRLFLDGDRALIAANVVELSRILADDYLQYDESGKAFSKQDVIDNLRAGSIRYLSMVSTGRRIRMLGEVAIVHGSEDDEVESINGRSNVRYIYMDVVVKRDGKWQIVASQLAKPPADEQSR